jgi:pyrroloquinoline quinone biosynthesis protein D
MSDEARIPALRRGVKFRFDKLRDAWIVLAPERLFLPDPPAVEVLKLVDGARSLGAITDDLCARFDAPRPVVLADVAEMMRDLADKGVLSW